MNVWFELGAMLRDQQNAPVEGQDENARSLERSADVPQCVYQADAAQIRTRDAGRVPGRTIGVVLRLIDADNTNALSAKGSRDAQPILVEANNNTGWRCPVRSLRAADQHPVPLCTTTGRAMITRQSVLIASSPRPERTAASILCTSTERHEAAKKRIC